MKVGNDICEVKRFLELVSNKRFLDRVFTKKEQEHIFVSKDRQKQAERMAGKFSGKEAVSKALGLGISGGVDFLTIEILPDENGAPKVTLYGASKEIFEKMQEFQLEISISNTMLYASCVCVII